jgi:hypothetical protein
LRQAFRPIRINELFAAKPSPVEAVPKLNRASLNGELVDAARPIAFDALTGSVKTG